MCICFHEHKTLTNRTGKEFVPPDNWTNHHKPPLHHRNTKQLSDQTGGNPVRPGQVQNRKPNTTIGTASIPDIL